jgi:hypothetical protein
MGIPIDEFYLYILNFADDWVVFAQDMEFSEAIDKTPS